MKTGPSRRPVDGLLSAYPRGLLAPHVGGSGDMNVLGHTFVALAVGDDDPAYVLGAVLPDLAPMLNVRIDRSRLDGRVGEGVRCHIEAYAVFHGLAEFRSGAAALRRDLAGRGLDRGPVRALGHAGWELLLDGALVGSAAETAYWRALRAGASVLYPLAPPGPRRRAP